MVSINLSQTIIFCLIRVLIFYGYFFSFWMWCMCCVYLFMGLLAPCKYMWKPETDISTSLLCHLSASHCTQRSLVCLDWLASKSQESYCYLTRTGVIATQHLAWFSLECRDWTQVFVLTQQVFFPLSHLLRLAWDFSCFSSVYCYAYCTRTPNYLWVCCVSETELFLAPPEPGCFFFLDEQFLLPSSLLPSLCPHFFIFCSKQMLCKIIASSSTWAASAGIGYSAPWSLVFPSIPSGAAITEVEFRLVTIHLLTQGNQSESTVAF